MEVRLVYFAISHRNFALGYELARELNLESLMLKDLNAGNIRLNAMQAGMA